MILLKNDHAVFISMPRSATHTIHRVLREQYGGQQRRPPRDFHPNDVPREYGHWFLWTVVRNPYTRAASMYWYLLKHPRRRLKVDTFEEFCQLIRTRAADCRHGPLWPMWQQVGHLPLSAAVRFESLMADLHKLPFWRGPEQLSVAGASHPDRPLAEILTPRCVDLIRQWAGPDFEQFGYDPAEVPNG